MTFNNRMPTTFPVIRNSEGYGRVAVDGTSLPTDSLREYIMGGKTDNETSL